MMPAFVKFADGAIFSELFHWENAAMSRNRTYPYELVYWPHISKITLRSKQNVGFFSYGIVAI
jgi:hypothetical protein